MAAATQELQCCNENAFKSELQVRVYILYSMCYCTPHIVHINVYIHVLTLQDYYSVL